MRTSRRPPHLLLLALGHLPHLSQPQIAQATARGGVAMSDRVREALTGDAVTYELT